MPMPLSPEVLVDVESSIEHFNANHADTILLLARYGANCVAATDAEAVHVDSAGVEFAVRIGDETSTARLHFESEVATAAEVQGQVMAKIAAARSRAGEAMPVTSMEHEMANVGTLRTFDATVAGIRDLTPNLRELIIDGDFDEFTSLGADQFMYVFVGRDESEEVEPGYTMTRWMADDPATRPLGAYYTVRAWDPQARRITMWFVRHGHDAGVGGWVGRCRVGERIAVWGPRASFVNPPDATGYVFVADESGLAAVAVRIEELPDDADVTVIAETIDDDHVVPLGDRESVDVRWIFRGDAAPGVGERFLDAVKQIDVDRPGLVVFGAGESRQFTAIRRYLRRDRGLPATHVSMTGYWRRTPH